jgi:hypothetical protein
MKLNNYILLAAISVIVSFIDCKKDSTISTTLVVRIIDQQGINVTGATVSLYTNLDDMEKQTNPIGSIQTSDANGEVTFSNLDAATYYWIAEKGCENNANGIYTSSSLVHNKTNTVTSTLSPTGTLKLVNQSQNQYQVYINGFLLMTANAGTTYTYIWVPLDSYTIDVQQVSGASEYTYNGTITCGSTLTITFPGK